jgi:PiT family inorganic phosphate transporter
MPTQSKVYRIMIGSPSFAADSYGLPVSTTHVLSSGVAGTMAANGSGIALAWVLTLPVAMMLSGFLYLMFSQIF